MLCVVVFGLELSPRSISVEGVPSERAQLSVNQVPTPTGLTDAVVPAPVAVDKFRIRKSGLRQSAKICSAAYAAVQVDIENRKKCAPRLKFFCLARGRQSRYHIACRTTANYNDTLSTPPVTKKYRYPSGSYHFLGSFPEWYGM